MCLLRGEAGGGRRSELEGRIHHSLLKLPAFAGKSVLDAIVETPKGSENKFDFDPDSGLFELGTAMPAGVVFPFEFGFVPSTLGQDGDPVDVLVLMDSPTFVGCLVKIRLVGVIEIRQGKEGEKLIRNDRLVAVALESKRHERVRKLRDLSAELLAEIEHFFASYNAAKGRKLKVLGRFGPKRARDVVKAGMRRAKRKR